ncbi:39267_t:CDS:2, partial [Gigaspora margarita]
MCFTTMGKKYCWNEIITTTLELCSVASNKYEIISLEEFLPETKKKQYHYLSNFTIDSTIILYCYHYGNYLGTLNFIWKISENFEL